MLVIVVVPKVDQINQRLGPLAQEFNELVYPANYNPESKAAAKRKSGQGCQLPTVGFTLTNFCDHSVSVSIFYCCAADNEGGAEKKPKADVPEEELRAHVQNGTLGKLTVPVLKEACKRFGVRTSGTKKQELIDALIARLCS